jgi:hypothetical protein
MKSVGSSLELDALSSKIRVKCISAIVLTALHTSGDNKNANLYLVAAAIILPRLEQNLSANSCKIVAVHATVRD